MTQAHRVGTLRHRRGVGLSREYSAVTVRTRQDNEDKDPSERIIPDRAPARAGIAGAEADFRQAW